MSINFESIYGKMAYGPAGPSVFSLNMHEVNFSTEVMSANQNMSLMLPLDTVAKQMEIYLGPTKNMINVVGFPGDVNLRENWKYYTNDGGSR